MKTQKEYLSLNIAILPSIVKGTSLSEQQQTIAFEVNDQLKEGEFFLFINLDVGIGKVSKVSPPLSSLKDFKNTSICDALLIYKHPSSSFIAVCFIEMKNTADIKKIEAQIKSTYSTIFKEGNNFIKFPYTPKFFCFYASHKSSPTNKDKIIEIENKKLFLVPLRKNKKKFDVRGALLKLLL